MRSQRKQREITLFCAMLLSCAMVQCKEPLRVKIGLFDETILCSRVGSGMAMAVGSDACSTSSMVVRFVIPDDLEGHSFDIELLSSCTTVARRAGTTSGIGRRSIILVPLNCENTQLKLVNRSAEPLLLESVQAVAFPNASRQPPDDFTLALLLDANRTTTQTAHALDRLTTVPGIRKAAGFEIHFAKLPLDVIRKQLTRIRDVCETHHVPALISPCSWWGGTPREVWHHPEFQQVCWSTANNGPAADSLKDLVGARWSPHYGFTSPNMWGNTPWQTMNNPELNALRAARLQQVVPLIEEELHGKIAGYVSENEPAYWAFEASDTMYPVRRPGLSADFNPSTVADAKRDGIDLDPADGLSISERMWLHENASRYIQQNVNVLAGCSPSAPIYSHALLEQHFPMQGTGHYRPYAEVGRVRGARVGLELLRKANFDALWRAREWGPWGCVNREENDGVAMEYHTGMLQLVYAMGADLFNSYNWNSTNENDRAIGYMNDFLASVQAGEIVVGERSSGTSWVPLTTEITAPLEVNYSFPWANTLSLDLRADDPCTSLAVWLTRGAGGTILTWHNIRPKDLPSTGPMVLNFGDMLKLEQDDAVTLHIRSSEQGWGVRMGAEGPKYRLWCDISRARQASQLQAKRVRLRTM